MSATTEAYEESPESYPQWVACSHHWTDEAGKCMLCGGKAATK